MEGIALDKFDREIFSRNLGILSEKEQGKLQKSAIAIAGVGGIGGLLAERLARTGIGKLKITDPGTYEKSNLNRQFGSSLANLERNKAEVVFSQIKDINPGLDIRYSTTGINTEADAVKFVKGCDLVIDEMDFGLFKQSVALQRAARNSGKYYFFTSAIGFGALTVIFEPGGLTIEEFDGLPADIELKDLNKVDVPLSRVIPIIPSYVPIEAGQALKDVYSGKRAVPTISIGVGLASVLAANEAINIILRKREIVTAPRFVYVDLMDRKFIIGNVTD
jgi:molybdopterin/thiamine biosynthesis adenylyltransferase